MARSYSSKEVKALQRKYKELYAKFSQLDNLKERSRSQIQAAASKIAANSSADILRDIPVDELSRHKKGLRVKLLHDAGIHTVADVIKASPFALSSINGISPEGAQEIKNIASSIADTAQKGAKIPW